MSERSIVSAVQIDQGSRVLATVADGHSPAERQNPVAGSLDQLRSAIPALADEARFRAEEFEQLRKIPLDFVLKLKTAGVYRVLVSERQGGLGGDLIDWFEMATSLAEADASTGWTCAHGAVTNALVANIADQQFVEALFSDPNASTAWSNLARVEANEVDGGLRITGRWAFETGCTGATYVGGMLAFPREIDDGERKDLGAKKDRVTQEPLADGYTGDE